MFKSKFSHIYIENGARDYPMTQHILSLYSKAIQVDINHYKAVFNRPRQVPGMQRQRVPGAHGHLRVFTVTGSNSGPDP